MKLFTPNGDAIIGTKETVPGTAVAQEYKPDGEPIYDGQTDMWWDDQKTVWSQGSRVYIDEGGDEWRFDELMSEDKYGAEGDGAAIDDNDAAYDRMIEEERLSGFDRSTITRTEP